MARPDSFATRLRRLVTPAMALALTALLGFSGVLGKLDRAWHDLLQRSFAERAPLPAATALVLIDEQSMQALGREPFTMRWPWPRGAFAALIAGLYRAGAERIVVDLAFLEHSNAAEQDLLLGAVAAGVPGVTLATMPGLVPAVWSDDFQKQHAQLFQRRRWGLVKTEPDGDGVIRLYVMPYSLMEVARGEEYRRDSRPWLRWRGNLKQLQARGVPVVPAAPFVAAGWTMLERATEQAPDLNPLALVKAIDTEPAPEGAIFSRVKGRTVFVGANAAGTFDMVATPVGAPEPGVIVHWSAWASAVANDFLHDDQSFAGLLLPLVVVWVVFFEARKQIGLRRPALAAAAAVVVVVGLSVVGFLRGRVLPPTSSVAGAAISFTAVAVESFRRERARKREIQGWFGAYVSPAVVKRLVENPDALKLGGERREVSVYFSDLVGFTSLSERLPADTLVTLVNVCLEDLSGAIFDHGGYLDKYIGDAIMGVFGSPEELANHALSATRAALESQRRLKLLNERFAREFDGVQLGMRVGVNTGEAIVGNVGSERKKNFTVLGDTVNLASRLEGANKEFHTPILLGPKTAALVAGEIVTRPVARLRVKGKTQAVEVFEPLGEISGLDETSKRFAAAGKEGFDAWSARRFEQAVRAFSDALVLRPDDFLTTRYLADARRLAATPPPPDWEPVLNLESK